MAHKKKAELKDEGKLQTLISQTDSMPAPNRELAQQVPESPFPLKQQTIQPENLPDITNGLSGNKTGRDIIPNNNMLPPVQPEVKIGKEDVRKATEILHKYKQGKANLESRVIANEQWWKLRNWEQIGKSKNPTDPEPASAWLFNSISNKHADAMDNFPQPNVLPREESDRKEAQMLSSILPVILEQNEYEQTYSDLWWSKLISGTAVTGVFWNNNKDNGLGDVDIKQIDILSLFWQPGIKDIQQSRNVFNVELIDNDILEEQYPHLKGKLGNSSIQNHRSGHG